MQNEEVIRIIDNLKGRRKYEEKKAIKLGFSSLYEYFEDKLFKQKKTIEDKEKELELNKAKNNFAKKELSKKTCGCC
jgi:flagellin-specific chaperone FliS